MTIANTLTKILTATAQTPMAGPPVHERLAAELRDAERELPFLAERYTAANFDHLAGPQSPETAAALREATSALADGRAHIEALRSALVVSQERAMVRAERERAARFAKSQKALAAHLTSRDRLLKKACAHLESYIIAWHAAIAATGQIQTALGDLGLKQPVGAMLSVREMREVIENEIHRIDSVQNPLRASQVGYNQAPPGAQSHDLRTKFNGRALPAIAAVLKEKSDHLLRWFAGREMMVSPPSVTVARMPAVVFEPGQLEALKVQNAEQMAELTAPTPPAWDAASLEAMKAEYEAVRDPVGRIDPDLYDEGEATGSLSTLNELMAPELDGGSDATE